MKIAVFSEGVLECVEDKEYATVAEARAWCDGLSNGAEFYGGSSSAYVLPDDQDAMLKNHPRGGEAAMKIFNRMTGKVST